MPKTNISTPRNWQTEVPHNCETCGNPLSRRVSPNSIEHIGPFNERKYCDRLCMGMAYSADSGPYLGHGQSRKGKETGAYKSWKSMRRRCGDPGHDKYKYYGERGITVDERWRGSFESFFADMGDRPEGTTLERRNNNGNYEPGNCYWATKSQQMRNKRDNLLLTHQNKTQCAAAWSQETGIPLSTIQYRVKAGWDHARVLTQPLRFTKRAIGPIGIYDQR